MLNTRPILLVTGSLLTTLSIAMVFPAVVDAFTDNADWRAFAISAFFTSFIGITLILTNQSDEQKGFTLKQAFIITTTAWVVIAMFAALPFMFANLGMSYTDAFFEAMSGLTTTGATVMVGLDNMPPGILLWRSILQWLGGIGIIVMAMAILPVLKIGGMQLFRTESSDKSEKVLPRVTQISSAITGIYLFLTIICAIALWIVGMGAFDAICHAMTTISTGGFSSHDASIGHFNNLAIEAVIMFFMIMGGIPFVLYIQAMRGKPWVLFRDTQVKWFLYLLVIAITALSSWLAYNKGINWKESLMETAFNIVSIVTTTGYATRDYNQWGSFAVTVMFLLSVVGGCTGSTSGGIKIFRYQVLYETAKAQLNQLIQPHGVFRPLFNGKPISETAMSSVMSFFILFAFCFSVLAVLLSFTGLDYITSMSGAATVMANVGPGLGDIIGPSGNYSSLPDSAKWLLATGMLVGRLEIFTVLILFSPYFWRN